MPTTNVNWESVNAFAGTVRVYTRQFWANSWTLVDNLWPTFLSWNLLPDTPIATFRSDYGPVLPTGDDTWVTVAKQNVLGYYVRVEVDCADGTLSWVGFIDDVVDYQGGITGGVPYGRMEITAYAMSHCLAYETILSCYWWDGSAKRESGSGIPFGKNRTATIPGGQPTHLFSAKADATYWSSRDIANYLITHHAPKNAAGTNVIPFELLNANILPDWEKPDIETDRVSVWEILEQIIDRRMFLAASIGYNLATNKNQLSIHSLAPANVTLGTGRTLLGSSNLLTISCHADHATRATVRSTATSVWHQVRARGDRRRSVATLVKDDGLAFDWDSTDVTDFNAAASGAAGYGAETLETQRAMNASKRSTGKLVDVFSRLKVPDNFDWQLGTNFVFQTDDVSPTRHYAFPGLVKIEEKLPLQTGVDYSSDRIATDTVNFSKKGSERPPFCIVEDPKAFVGNVDLASRFAIYVEPGNALRVMSSEEAILLGGAEYIPLAADVAFDSSYDLATIQATVSLLDDRFAEGVETSALAATADQVRKIAIDCGNLWQRIWVLDDTVVELDEDGLEVKVTEPGFLEDDKDVLDSYAKMIGLWYLVPRNLLSIESARPSAAIFVGQLCTTLNAATSQAVTINTVVTSITLALPIGTERAGVPQYTVQTAATLFDPSIL